MSETITISCNIIDKLFYTNKLYQSMQTIVTSWRTQPIQTISEISAHIKILPAMRIPLYQELSFKVKNYML